MKDVKKDLLEALKAAINKSSKAGVPKFILQTICSVKEEKSVDKILKKSLKPFQLTDYIPAEDKPLTFICINLHVFQNSAGTKNFSKTNIGEFRQIFDWINGFYTNYQVPDYVGICNSKPVLPQQLDSRIRFILNRIEFYKDDLLCNQGLFNSTLLVNAMLQRDSSMDAQLNIFLTAPDANQPAWGYTQFPSNIPNFKQFIHTVAPPPYIQVDFSYSQHWAHELGHVLGLPHTYGGANCNENDPFYLYDIHGCNPNNVCPILTTNNNLMGGHDSWSISTLQSALMHYSLTHLSVKQYATNICCPKCVAFGARIDRHKSQGGELVLEYDNFLANESWAWDGKLFTCPIDGVYNFTASFQKDSLVDGGTPNNVWLHILADWDIIGTIMSEKADLKSDWSPGTQQFGRRDTVSMNVNVKLNKNTVVKTVIKSENGEMRNIVDVVFCGQLLCSCCC